MPERLFDLKLPGKLRRQENGPQAGWRKKASYRKAWRTKVKAAGMMVVRKVQKRHPFDPTKPKTVRIRARVFNLYDEGGLWSALKPVIDGLVDAEIIHSDAPFEKSGHRILPSQQIDRSDEGVTIHVLEGVEPVAPLTMETYEAQKGSD